MHYQLLFGYKVDSDAREIVHDELREEFAARFDKAMKAWIPIRKI